MPENSNNFLEKHVFHNQFLTALLILVVVWIIYQLRDIFMLLFFSYIFMAALSPFVEFFVKQRVPRMGAILITYLITLSILFIVIFPVIPFFSSQIQSLLVNFPKYLDEAAKAIGVRADFSQLNTLLTSQLGNISENAVAVTTVLFGVFFSIVTVFVISFYLLVDHEHMKKGFIHLFPRHAHQNVEDTLSLVEDKLGAWFRGQILLSFSIGLFTWIAYTIIGLQYALPLALLAGLLEAVPTIGPFLGAVPAVIVALTISPTRTFLVIIVYILIQTIESNLLVPKIMERAVGLNPIIIILGILIGAKLLGIMGALISIPFITMLLIIYNSTRGNGE